MRLCTLAREPTKKETSEVSDLTAFFHPTTVALIGATEAPSSIGRAIFSNLAAGSFSGKLYPVNPKHLTVLGYPAFPSLDKIPGPVDLAVIATPALTVPGVVRECVAKNVKAAMIISAGFREIGLSGCELEAAIRHEAAKGKLRIIGPNCLGLMSPAAGLNATFASASARTGNVAFLSQSGALCTAVLDWSLRANLGFSAFVSTGSMVDVGWGDLIDYLGSDPHTKAILLYIESIEDARAFLSAAREVALTKPIIAVKAGRTAAAGIAAASHTGAMTGSDAVLDAAFHRCGVMRVNRISDLFYMADLLAKQPRPRGPRLTILTNAGGPAVLAADSLILNGGELATLSENARTQLDAILPQHWSHANPIDILGDASAERYEKALEILSHEKESDGFLIIMAPQAVESSSNVAQRLKGFRKIPGKPVLASFMGGAAAEQAAQIIEQNGVPNFPYPDTAAKAFGTMWQYASHLKSLYETPIASKLPDADSERAASVIAQVRAAGRTLLSESEAKMVLAAHGIAVTPTVVAHTIDEAAAAARYPVVLKVHSTTITHKSDVGGVKLGIRTEAGLRQAYDELTRVPGFEGVTVEPMVSHANAYEVIFGAIYDPQFGPVILFGSGGELVEVYQDRALGLPPLNSTLALRLMEETRIFRALKGVRGRPPCDMTALTDALVRFSSLILQHPEISEIDVNPLLAGPSGCIALDARMVLFEPGVTPPRPAIRPYPSQYMWEEAGATIRPIRPEDEPLMIGFHETLSDQTVYFRYFAMIRLSQRISHERLSRICFVDYDREIALVALREVALSEPRVSVSGQGTEFFELRSSGSGQGQELSGQGLSGSGQGPEVPEPRPPGRDQGAEFFELRSSESGQGQELSGQRSSGSGQGPELSKPYPSGISQRPHPQEIVAVGRISRIRGTEEVEFAVVVNDRFQKQGWGTRILKRLIEIARAEGCSAVVGEILFENRGMQHVCRNIGFALESNLEDGVVRAVYDLRGNRG